MGRLYPMFLYGTLRPGQPLWPHIKNSVDGKARVAYVHGYRLYTADTGTYPYMVESPFRNSPRVVRGTLVHLTWTDAVGDIILMEQNAGYNLETVEVRAKPLGEVIGKANAFVFPARLLGRDEPLCDPFMVEGDRTAVGYDWARHVLNNRLPGPEEVESIGRIHPDHS